MSISRSTAVDLQADYRSDMPLKKIIAFAALLAVVSFLMIISFMRAIIKPHYSHSLPSLIRYAAQPFDDNKPLTKSYAESVQGNGYLMPITPKFVVEDHKKEMAQFGQISSTSKMPHSNETGYTLLDKPKHVHNVTAKLDEIILPTGQSNPLEEGIISRDNRKGYNSINDVGNNNHRHHNYTGKSEDTSDIPKLIPHSIMKPQGSESSVINGLAGGGISYSLNGDSKSVGKEQQSKLNLFSHDKLVRNCITGEVIGQIPGNLRAKSLSHLSDGSIRKSPENRTVRKTSFTSVFRNKKWGHSWDGTSNKNGFDMSGRGSTLTWTQEAIAGLHAVILQLKMALNKTRIQILDVPCGDMKWMSRFLETRDDVDYVGIDVVPELIAHHKKAYRDRGWRFLQLDVVEDGIPVDGYDLIVSRTFLQHLYTADVLRVLKKFSESGSKYLFTTTFSKLVFNFELDLVDNQGRFRQLNLEVPPIALIPPLCTQRDGPPHIAEALEHFLALWPLPLLQVVNCDKVKHFRIMNTGQDVYSCVEWSPYINLN